MITFPFTENGVSSWQSPLVGIISLDGVSKWIAYSQEGLAEWLESHNVLVKGATVMFPDEETKMLFILRWM